jgi:hypothetical protein
MLGAVAFAFLFLQHHVEICIQARQLSKLAGLIVLTSCRVNTARISDLFNQLLAR